MDRVCRCPSSVLTAHGENDAQVFVESASPTTVSRDTLPPGTPDGEDHES